MRQFVFITLFLFAGIFCHATTTHAADPVGQAAVVRGEVYVTLAGVQMKQPLNAGDDVHMGDTIRTGEKGRVQLIFDDDSIFTIGRNAEISVDEFIYDPASGAGRSDIKAKKGTFKFVTGKIAKKAPEAVKMRTPFATIGVRGSGGIVQIQPNGATVVGLTQCCLDIHANNAPPGAPPVPLEQVNTFSEVADPNQPPTPPAPMPPEMFAALNSDLAGGFAPAPGEEGEDGTPPPPPGEEDAADPNGEPGNNEAGDGPAEGGEPPANGSDDGTPPPPEEGGENGPVDNTSPPPDEEGNTLPPLAEGTEDDPQDGAPPPPPPGEEGDGGTLDGTAPPPPPPGDGSADGGFIEGDAPPPPDGTTFDGAFIDDGTAPPPPDGTLADGTGDTFGDFGFDDGFTGDGGDTFFTEGDVFTGGDDTTGDPLLPPPPPDAGDTTQASQDNTATETTNGGDSTAPSTHVGVFKRLRVGENFIREGDAVGKLLSGGQFSGTFNDFDGTSFTGILPVAGAAGDFLFPPFTFNNVTFEGNGYRSGNGDLLLYDLHNAAGDRLSVAVGTLVPSLPTSGINLFRFREDPLLDEGAFSFDEGGNFDPNASGVDQIGPPVGLAVDWGRRKFLGGSLDIFNDAGSGDYFYEVTVGFGEIETAAGHNAYGYSVGLGMEQHGAFVAPTEFEVGDLEVFEVYGSNGNVSGFLLDINNQFGNHSVISGLNQQEYSINPLTRLPDDPLITAEAAGLSTARLYTGFVGGHMFFPTFGNGADVYDRITSRSAYGGVDGGVAIELDTLGEVTASLKAWDDGGKIYEATFGGLNGLSAAITPRAYAAAQNGSSIDRGDLMVAAPLHDHTNTNDGSVYDFQRISAALLSASGELLAGDAELNDYFGYGLAVSGNKALVGAYTADAPGNATTDAGGLYAFERDNLGNWTAVGGPFLPSGFSAGDRVGQSIAMDGDFAIVGAPNANEAYLFHWDGVQWVEQLVLDGATAGFSGGASFGYDVDIKGSRLIVGAPTHNTDEGAFAIYDWDGFSWAQTASSTGSTGDTMGRSVALDGDVAVAGIPGASTSGEIMIRRFNGTSWDAGTTLAAPTNLGGSAQFGISVDVDGNLMAIGADLADLGTTDTGAALVYRYDDTLGDWLPEAEILGSTTVSGHAFGTDVSLSGGRLAVGSINGSGSIGEVFVFERTPAPAFNRWQQAASGMNKVAAGTSALVAVGNAGEIWRSTNGGHNWVMSSADTFGSGVVNDVLNVGGTTWVAVGNNGTNGTVNISTDNGDNWAVPTAPPAVGTDQILNVAFNGATMLALTNTGQVAASSDGGDNWNAPTSVFTGMARDAVHTPSGWVAVGYDGSYGAFNTGNGAGTTWSGETALPGGFGAGDVAYSIDYDPTRNRLVVVGSAGSWVYSDDAGTTWNAGATMGGFIGGTIRDVTFANNQWFAVGDDGSGNAVVYTSIDGTQWQPFMGNTLPTQVNGITFDAVNNTWVAVDNTGNFNVLDGTMWEETQAVVSGDGAVNDEFGRQVVFSGATVSTENEGALLSDFLTHVKCADCQYVHWGVWAGKLENAEIGTGEQVGIAHMVPYVAGEVTSAAELNGFTGGGSYGGPMVGSVVDGGQISHHVGDFTASVNFATRSVNFTGNFAGDSLTASGSNLWGAGQNAYQLNIDTNASVTAGGKINGAFFGPNAQDVGGNFHYDRASGATAAGIYLGNDPAR